MSEETAVDVLAETHGQSWDAIAKCREGARSTHARVMSLLRDQSMVPSDCEFVAFGSLAREEITTGSDLDWTLLVDGARAYRNIRRPVF